MPGFLSYVSEQTVLNPVLSAQPARQRALGGPAIVLQQAQVRSCHARLDVLPAAAH